MRDHLFPPQFNKWSNNYFGDDRNPEIAALSVGHVALSGLGTVLAASGLQSPKFTCPLICGARNGTCFPGLFICFVWFFFPSFVFNAFIGMQVFPKALWIPLLGMPRLPPPRVALPGLVPPAPSTIPSNREVGTPPSGVLNAGVSRVFSVTNSVPRKGFSAFCQSSAFYLIAHCPTLHHSICIIGVGRSNF